MTKTRIIELDDEDFVVRAPTLKQLRENTDKLIISSEEPNVFQMIFSEVPEGDYARNINGYLELFRTQRAKMREASKTVLHNGAQGARGF
jgi:hypothetical protein